MTQGVDNRNNDVKRMRIEILVASPPTSKCKSIIRAMQMVVEKYPDQLRLDIYYAGMQLSIKPTCGYQAENKAKKVPSVFINGMCVASGEVPDFNEVEEITQGELSKGADSWEA